MKKFLLTGSFIFAFLFVNLIFAASAPKTLLLSTQEWPPYQTYNNNILDGIAVRVVECVLGKMNQPYKITVYPWKRAQFMVENEEYHGFFSASKNDTRDQYSVQSGAIAEQKWNWYTLKNSLLNPRDTSFKKKVSVSSRIGSSMYKWLEKNEYNIKAKPKNTERLFKLLINKRVGAVLASELVAKEVIVKLNLSDSLKTVLNRNKPLGLYFSKAYLANNPEFLEQFNGLIKECR